MNRFRKYLLSISFVIGLLSNTNAIDVSISKAVFLADKQPLVELYFSIIGKSVVFEQIDSLQSQAKVEILVLFKNGEEIVQFDKYSLNSPISENGRLNFVDQKRYALPNGKYTIEVEIKDLNNPSDTKTWTESLDLGMNTQEFFQSDIQLLGAFKESEPIPGFTKNGYFLESLPFNFYNKRADKLAFYTEIYNADKLLKEEYLIRYFIDLEGDNGKRTAVKLGNKKRTPEAISVLLLSMDIKELKSGNYFLVVEVRSKAGDLISAREVFFQRSNPYYQAKELATADVDNEFVAALDAKELKYALRAIAMNVKAADSELVNLLLAEKQEKSMRSYLFSYWARKNPNQPKEAFDRYMKVAKAVDKTFFEGFGPGFESDRGNIYMRFGQPNDKITVENEPSAPPYEIWVYEDFPWTSQSRVKFIFYNPSLAGGGYQLLHSNAIGEVNNPRWEVDLYSDAPDEIEGTNAFDATRMNANTARNARRYFEDL